VVDSRVTVGVLAAVRDEKAVQRAVAAFPVEETRTSFRARPGAQRDRVRGEGAAALLQHVEARDVERRLRLPLDPVVFDDGIGSHGDLGHRVREVRSAVDSRKALSQRHLAPLVCDEHHPGVKHPGLHAAGCQEEEVDHPGNDHPLGIG